MLELASNVSRRFGDQRVLDGLDLTVGEGEVVALLGRSGSGKSTLLRLLAKLDEPDAGRVAVPDAVAVVFQEPRLFPWLSVLDNVTIGLPDTSSAAGLDALAEVGLADKSHAWPLTLSGGEAQRVALARALVRQPRLMLFDEPFGALDALTRIAMHQLVVRLWERHAATVVLVTHDVDEAVLLADRVLVLDAGRIAHAIEITRDADGAVPGPELLARRADLLTLLGVEQHGTLRRTPRAARSVDTATTV
ncbi:ABC transporter ATP-binding protein [Micromonospora cathayae]|uniref:ABC transporter ATP-binding protein n=1 Tax=Micromonospora cathayae TaxID=3028804 RepID=A0ABY7ZNE7_9ACTN|nr:ABC transporter ATP-binding protein [Micromonospora sp. HUAS 3]WDZ84388.1 ABC transporter ATP-binding protein [Micromonospora sp. HUAS 3]